MSSSSLPNGVLAASLTPLTAEKTPDGPALAHHVQHLFQTGCDGVLLFGTTGEGLSFTIDERTSALDAVLDAGVPPDRLLVGTGALALPDAVTLTAHATEHRVGGVLVLPPFHLPTPSNAGLVAAYTRIIEQVNDPNLSLYFYHFPQLTGVSIPFPVIDEVRTRHPDQVAGIKDSSGEWDHLDALCSSFPNLQVFTGTERYLSPLLNAGGAGCISATANLTAPIAQTVYQTWRDGDNPESVQAALSEQREALSRFPTIPTLKQLMAWREDRPTWRRVRPPLAPLAPETRDQIRPVYETLEIACSRWALD